MNYTLWINKELRFQPFVFRDAVDREEWYQDRSFLDIFLEVGVVAVGDRLAYLQAASSAEHHIDDADVADGGDDPLPCWTWGADADHERTCPYHEFA